MRETVAARADARGKAEAAWLKPLFTLFCQISCVPKLTQPEDLVARSHRARRVLACSLAAAGLLLVASLFLLEPGSTSGPRDVHLPTGIDFASGRAAGGTVPGTHIVGARVATLQHVLAYLINIGSAVALGALLFSLVRKRGMFALYAIGWFLLMGFVRPVSPPVQGDPPQAVGVAAARSLLGLHAGESVAGAVGVGRSEAGNARAYVAAQVAFIEGDREIAARLARNVNAERLGSPIEAPFRLQFLRGTYQGLTTVCFVRGCLLEHERTRRLAGTALAGMTALFASFAAASLMLILRKRLRRIEALRATGRRRDLGLA